MRGAWKVTQIDPCLSTCHEYTDPLCLWRRDSGSGTCWRSLHRRWQSGFCVILPALCRTIHTSVFLTRDDFPHQWWLVFLPSLSSVFHLAVNIKDALLEGGPSMPAHLAVLTVALAALALLLSFLDSHPLLVHRLPRSGYGIQQNTVGNFYFLPMFSWVI